MILFSFLREPKRFVPSAKIQFLDTGHFAIETHVVEIAFAMKEFLAANGVTRQSGSSGAR